MPLLNCIIGVADEGTIAFASVVPDSATTAASATMIPDVKNGVDMLIVIMFFFKVVVRL